MKFRTGAVVGFGVGYVLGAKAGRERYEQIKRWFDGFMESEVAAKGKAVLDLSAERARLVASSGLHAASDQLRKLGEG